MCRQVKLNAIALPTNRELGPTPVIHFFTITDGQIAKIVVSCREAAAMHLQTACSLCCNDFPD